MHLRRRRPLHTTINPLGRLWPSCLKSDVGGKSIPSWFLLARRPQRRSVHRGPLRRLPVLCQPAPQTSFRAEDNPLAWPFAVWGLDMIGPLRTGKHGFTHILVAVDK